MIQAFKTVKIPIQIGEEEREIEVPFTVELLRRVEDTIRDATGKRWFVLSKSEKSIVEAFEKFCKPYFPADFDFTQVQPTFCGLFFWHVRSALERSINEWEDCMTSTAESGDLTEAKSEEKARQ
jgi:hypothetical protein